MSAFTQNENDPEPLEAFWPYLARTNPELMKRVNALDEHLHLEAFLIGGQVQREADLFHARKDNSYERIARALTGKQKFDLSEYLFGPAPVTNIEEVRDEDRADALAAPIIERIQGGDAPAGDEPPPHEDKDAPHEGSDVAECADSNCPCFVEGVLAACEVLGADPDDVFNALEDLDDDGPGGAV